MNPIQPGNKAVMGGGVGAALGVVVVVFLPKFGVELDATEASMLTAAFGTIFAWAIRHFLPTP